MTSPDVTGMVQRLGDGDEDVLDHLLPVIYDELKLIAGRQLRRDRPERTLSSTALVHEAYVKLVRHPPRGLENRAHFFGVAARAMRQILVEHERRRRAAKRGGDGVQVTLTDLVGAQDAPSDDLLALDQALDRLDELDPRLRRTVEFRFFAGMTEQEIAEVLGVTPRTVQRDWAKARAWLYKELYPEPGSPHGGP